MNLEARSLSTSIFVLVLLFMFVVFKMTFSKQNSMIFPDATSIQSISLSTSYMYDSKYFYTGMNHDNTMSYVYAK